MFKEKVNAQRDGRTDAGRTAGHDISSLTYGQWSKKCFLFFYMYIDLLKLKAYKLFENSDADLSWLLFKETNLFYSQRMAHTVGRITAPLIIIKKYSEQYFEKKNPEISGFCLFSESVFIRIVNLGITG